MLAMGLKTSRDVVAREMNMRRKMGKRRVQKVLEMKLNIDRGFDLPCFLYCFRIFSFVRGGEEGGQSFVMGFCFYVILIHCPLFIRGEYFLTE